MLSPYQECRECWDPQIIGDLCKCCIYFTWQLYVLTKCKYV